ncbi:putative hydrolase [Cyphellophora attinorum]|uniref:Putative hydrolase n=1 Tax=Cyphellophora attinorum TaxID=1664694 RepID=A0A0N0NIN1_9EURO|nr:putative hydrolase [Phialophora attinorum]KPI36021.1 putative hydrolase [Phialophora attinorum]
MSNNQVYYRTIEVDSVNVFYREAGATSLPGLLLLHGHASASHTFRNIIPELSKSFRVVAPDYPGFGNSDMPDPEQYVYTFANIASTIDKFTEQIGLKTFFLYIFDYGAPIGLTIAAKHPGRIAGIFSQSGNAYEEGLSPAFAGLREWWADASKTDAPNHILSLDGVDWAYKLGVEPSLVGPDAAALDKYYISRTGAHDIQMRILRDYETNLSLYPEWQAYLRKHKPKLVALWGKNDPFFIPPGAEAFKRDVPDADVSIIDACHFLNESHPQEVIKAIKKLL